MYYPVIFLALILPLLFSYRFEKWLAKRDPQELNS